MLTTNVQLTLVMLLLVPMIGLLVTVISRRFRKISHRIQDMMGNVSHVTEEAVVGQQVVKVFRGQEAEKARFAAGLFFPSFFGGSLMEKDKYPVYLYKAGHKRLQVM
jgi:ABC-type multidrug transport system fused ATPase/permease subunit